MKATLEDVKANKDPLLVLLSEVGSQKRHRSDSEDLYSAAALGSFGAVTWGVAALQSESFKGPILTHPALIAAIGVLLVAGVVVAKIRDDSATWGKIKADEAMLAGLLSLLPGATEMIPPDMTRRERGPGRWHAERVVCVAAIAATTFCPSVFALNAFAN
jgi:hypothetical protein